MKNTPVKKNGKTYNYILTVQDVFSRYVWLRPLTGKASHLVARELYKLYAEFGPPRVIQSDNGGELKKAVEKLCRSLGIKIIRGSPYHPQSQGKVERSHRSLRKKISFDLVSFARVGVNWVSKLTEYQKVLNEDPKDVLGKHSPFEVFYGRDSNAVSQMVDGGKLCQESGSRAANVNPRNSDYKNNADLACRIRAKALASNNVWDKRYIQRKVKGNPPSIYKVGETIMLRFPFSRTNRVAPKKRFVLEGQIIKRKLRLGKYQVIYKSPTTYKKCTQWVSVEDITSTTVSEEKRKRTLARKRMSRSRREKRKDAKKSIRRESYRIPITREERYEPFLDQGYEVSFNPAGDGNCQFAAVSWFLQTIGIFRSEESLRKEVVEYLSQNPQAQDGFPLELFVGVPWSQYLASMSQNGAYGDQITLQAMADLYNVELIVISSLGQDAQTVISPQHAHPFASYTLGHFAEDDGIHYVCLMGENNHGITPDDDSRGNRVSNYSNPDINGKPPRSGIGKMGTKSAMSRMIETSTKLFRWKLFQTKSLNTLLILL